LALFFYAVGSAGQLLPGTRSLVASLAVFPLLVFGLAGLYPFVRRGGPSLALWALGLYAVSMAIEAVGVSTGVVFGPYQYTDVLGWRVAGVPLIIGLNWVIVVLGSWSLLRRIGIGPAIGVPLTALLAAGFDWVMEPAAVKLGYWYWDTLSIPLRNYLAWAIIAGLAALGLAFIERRRSFDSKGLAGSSWTIAVYLLIQLGYFALMQLVYPATDAAAWLATRITWSLS
jgi:putative membrane protein